MDDIMMIDDVGFYIFFTYWDIIWIDSEYFSYYLIWYVDSSRTCS